MKIGLLDDSVQFREMMEEFLIDAGHDVSGYDKLPNESMIADLFLIDWNLGGVTSEEAIRQLRSSNPDSIIWILTGSLLLPDLKKKMTNTGANGVLGKPIDPDDLLTLLQHIENDQWKDSKLMHKL